MPDAVTLPTLLGDYPVTRALRRGEITIVTFLLAKAHGKPLVLLPAVVLGRFGIRISSETASAVLWRRPISSAVASGFARAP
jgi:hypothetical protein